MTVGSPSRSAAAFRFRIRKFRELASTNTALRAEAEKGAAEGLVFTADYQSAGRGQFERKWISPAGKNLLFSVLLRPPVSARKAPMLTQIACRAVAQILLEKVGVDVTLKRPNDILACGRKLCGILVESAASGHQLNYAVVGIGLNVNAAPDALAAEAVSLKELTGREQNRSRLLKAILDQLKKDLAGFYAGTA